MSTCFAFPHRFTLHLFNSSVHLKFEFFSRCLWFQLVQKHCHQDEGEAATLQRLVQWARMDMNPTNKPKVRRERGGRQRKGALALTEMVPIQLPEALLKEGSLKDRNNYKATSMKTLQQLEGCDVDHLSGIRQNSAKDFPSTVMDGLVLM